jgi:hypothetical protein
MVAWWRLLVHVLGRDVPLSRQRPTSCPTAARYLRFLGAYGDYIEMLNVTKYVTTGANLTYGWASIDCTTTYDAMCEIPLSNYQCPPAPPPTPPPPAVDVFNCPPPDNDTFWWVLAGVADAAGCCVSPCARLSRLVWTCAARCHSQQQRAQLRRPGWLNLLACQVGASVPLACCA